MRPSETQKKNFRKFVASGRPVLAFHGGIVNHGDWPEYGRLPGFRWLRSCTGHPPYAEFPGRVEPDPHPITEGVSSFMIHDERCFNVLMPPEMPVRIRARAPFAEWVEFPMVMSAEGPVGRCPGAGRTAFLATVTPGNRWSRRRSARSG